MKKYFSSYWIRSAFYTILQRFSITLFGLINTMILIRSLPKPQMGVWAIFLVVTSIFEMTKVNLLKNAHIRYVSGSQDSNDKTAIASSSLLINASMTALFILLIIFFGNWLSRLFHSREELAGMLRWFIPGLIGMVFFSHFEAIQQSFLDFKGVFAGYFIRQSLFFTIILIHTIGKIPFTLSHLAIYQSICIFIGTLVIFGYSRPYLHYRFDPSKAWIKKIFGYGGYIFGSGIVANLFANQDQLMTATFMSTTTVAYYNAATRINQFIDVPSYAAADVIFPKVSKAQVEEGENKVLYLYERMVAVLLCFTVPLALFIICFPTFIIHIVAGSQYTAAALILQLYMVTGIFRPMQNQSANLLNSIGKQALCFVINTVSLLVYLCINYVCLKHFGFYGAAIGTLITTLLGNIAWYIIMRRQIGTRIGRIIGYMGDLYRLAYQQAMLFLKPKSANT